MFQVKTFTADHTVDDELMQQATKFAEEMANDRFKRNVSTIRDVRSMTTNMTAIRVGIPKAMSTTYTYTITILYDS